MTFDEFREIALDVAAEVAPGMKASCQLNIFDADIFGMHIWPDGESSTRLSLACELDQLYQAPAIDGPFDPAEYLRDQMSTALRRALERHRAKEKT